LARALLLELLDGGHRLVLSASILEEVERVLHYPRLTKRFGLTENEIIEFVTFLAASAEIVGTSDTIPTPIRDPGDVHVLQTAVNGRVDFLCTLDEHFKDARVIQFCSSRGITVVSDLNLLRLIRQK
jgi:putative PIN family toxin of toxin-antitoxin system